MDPQRRRRARVRSRSGTYEDEARYQRDVARGGKIPQDANSSFQKMMAQGVREHHNSIRELKKIRKRSESVQSGTPKTRTMRSLSALKGRFGEVQRLADSKRELQSAEDAVRYHGNGVRQLAASRGRHPSDFVFQKKSESLPAYKSRITSLYGGSHKAIDHPTALVAGKSTFGSRADADDFMVHLDKTHGHRRLRRAVTNVGGKYHVIYSVHDAE